MHLKKEKERIKNKKKCTKCIKNKKGRRKSIGDKDHQILLSSIYGLDS
jgi:hypothetical protein